MLAVDRVKEGSWKAEDASGVPEGAITRTGTISRQGPTM